MAPTPWNGKIKSKKLKKKSWSKIWTIFSLLSRSTSSTRVRKSRHGQISPTFRNCLRKISFPITYQTVAEMVRFRIYFPGAQTRYIPFLTATYKEYHPTMDSTHYTLFTTECRATYEDPKNLCTLRFELDYIYIPTLRVYVVDPTWTYFQQIFFFSIYIYMCVTIPPLIHKTKLSYYRIQGQVIVFI